MDIRRAQVALHLAEWWTQFLIEPAPLDNGDESPASAMGTVLGSLLQAKVGKPKPASCKRFTHELAQVIQNSFLELGRFTSWEPSVNIVTDYGPCGEIVSSFKKAQIDGKYMCNFPWKTLTKAYPARVIVAQGYRAPKETSLDLRTETEKSWMLQQECLNLYSEAERDEKSMLSGESFLTEQEYRDSIQHSLKQASEIVARMEA